MKFSGEVEGAMPRRREESTVNAAPISAGSSSLHACAPSRSPRHPRSADPTTCSNGDTRSRRPLGFTLIELIAATALSTLLFLAALSVIRSLGRTAPASGPASHGWTLALRQQLEWDLRNAVVIRPDDHAVVLGGYGSVDPQTAAGVHLPVVVSYSIREINGRRWLVRAQSSVDPLEKYLDGSDLLCGDIATFTITGNYPPPAVIDPAQGTIDDPTPAVFKTIRGSQPLPDRMRVRIDFKDDPSATIDAVLYLR